MPTRCVPSNPCLNGAECIDDEQYEGGVRCECGTGWTGATCAESKYDINNVNNYILKPNINVLDRNISTT